MQRYNIGEGRAKGIGNSRQWAAGSGKMKELTIDKVKLTRNAKGKRQRAKGKVPLNKDQHKKASRLKPGRKSYRPIFLKNFVDDF